MTTLGRYFEDFVVGQRLLHPLPRTLHGGDLSLYIALTGDRSALASSTEFARSLGFAREVVPELLVFHIVFGQSVADVSYRAVANLGYAEVKFTAPVYPGDTLAAESEVLGVRETSSRDAGVVYVRTKGTNQRGQVVVSFIRWVLVGKRDPRSPAPVAVVPAYQAAVPAAEVPVPGCLNLQRFANLRWVTGSDQVASDFVPGVSFVHASAMTLEEADHMQATRLYHNTARVHFDAFGMKNSKFGQRLIYGGHIISVAMALAQPEWGNVLLLGAWNGGVHAAPSFAGDTIRAKSFVLDRQPVEGRSDVEAVRLVLLAAKDISESELAALPLQAVGVVREPRVVLELDVWGLVPTA